MTIYAKIKANPVIIKAKTVLIFIQYLTHNWLREQPWYEPVVTAWNDAETQAWTEANDE